MSHDDEWVWVVTDIEVDGPHPGANSMRSFASVATTMSGETLGEFEAVLEPLPGAAPNPRTKKWFDSEPGTWEAATENARPIADVMRDYTSWIMTLPTPRAFCAAPLSFDGTWMDFYLRRFTPYGLHQGPYETGKLFTGPALCLRSYTSRAAGAQAAPALAGRRRAHPQGHRRRPGLRPPASLPEP